MRPLPLLALVLSGCQVAYVAHAREVRALLSEERYGAAADLESAREEGYSEGERVLFLLNRGVLREDAGRFAASNDDLQDADERLIAFHARSTGGALARGLAAGSAGDYLGEDFERVWVNVLGAMNHLALGDRDGALVEARRLDARLDVLGEERGRGRYRGDAFASWLSGLLHEDDGAAHDALLSYRAALAALPATAPFADARALVCHDLLRIETLEGAPTGDAAGCTPSTAPEDRPLGAGEGELVFVHRLGLVPARDERHEVCGRDPSGAVRCGETPSGLTSPTVQVALPSLSPVPSQIRGARLHVGARPPVGTELVADLEAMAMDSLAERLPEDEREAATRALARLAASTAVRAAESPANAPLRSLVVGVLSDASLSMLEGTDRRSWFTLPGKVRVARLRLPEGPVPVTIELLDADGRTVRWVDAGTVHVAAGRRTFVGLRSTR